MSKRRINKQQSERIEKIQQDYQLNKNNTLESLADGLVITRFSKHVEIETEQGKRIRCSIRPNLDILVAGDRVIWQPEGDKQGVVVSLYPRASILARPSHSGFKKPVAANITQMIVVIAPKPEISWPLLDSYLIMAETLHLQAVIVLNKIDLVSDEDKEHILSEYKPLNYPIVMVSKHQPSSFIGLQKTLDRQVSVFVGQSGVGKSSIISHILPHETNINTNELSLGTELGKHTTSNSRYYHLPTGGALIDSPGVREFSLWDIDVSTIAKGYQEFRPYLFQCKYRNCPHVNTPHCAIIEAIQLNQISQRRYDNFIKLCEQFKKTKH